MKKTQKKYCNLCGKRLAITDDLHITHRIGYGSVHDEDFLDMHICNSCLDRLIVRCVITPVIDCDQLNKQKMKERKLLSDTQIFW